MYTRGGQKKAWNRMVICLPFCLCLVTDLAHLDIPSIHVEVDATLHLDPSGQVQRHPVPGKIRSEEDSESTALWHEDPSYSFRVLSCTYRCPMNVAEGGISRDLVKGCLFWTFTCQPLVQDWQPSGPGAKPVSVAKGIAGAISIWLFFLSLSLLFV